MNCTEFLLKTSETYSAMAPFNLLVCLFLAFIAWRMLKWARNNDFKEEARFYTWAGFALALVGTVLAATALYTGLVRVRHPEQDSTAKYYCAGKHIAVIEKSE